MTLPAYAAERRAAAPLLQAPAAVDRYLLIDVTDRQTDRQTDGQTLIYRLCARCAGGVNKQLAVYKARDSLAI